MNRIAQIFHNAFFYYCQLLAVKILLVFEMVTRSNFEFCSTAGSNVYVDCAATVTCVSLTGDGQCILISTLDNSLYLIDKATGELLNEYVDTS